MSKIEGMLYADMSLSIELMQLGVFPVSVMWYFRKSQDQEYMLLCGRHFKYLADSCIPAWSKEELDFMVGNKYKKPDLPEISAISKTQDTDLWVVYFPTVMKQYRKGSNASAEGLIYLLENEMIDIDVLNKRYFERFGVDYVEQKT